MTISGSRYRPDIVSDYSHRFHAGNIGDVWKHCVLAEVLRRIAPADRVSYVESHAGEGSYALGPTGEWSEGVGRLWSDASLTDETVVRYVALCQRLGRGNERPEVYPGSPRLAQAVLSTTARLVLWERDRDVLAHLESELAGDERARLEHGDGLEHLVGEIQAAEARGDTVIALIDPPYTQKHDWQLVVRTLAAAATASTRACLLLWYPVKSLTRPNAMRTELENSGVSGTLAELVTTPLDYKRRRLNGSGLILVRPPDGLLGAIASAATEIGPRCATRGGFWSCRMLFWLGRGAD